MKLSNNLEKNLELIKTKFLSDDVSFLNLNVGSSPAVLVFINDLVDKISVGDKKYFNQLGKSLIAFKIGERFNTGVYNLFKEIFPKMDKVNYDLAYSFGKFGLVGLTHSWFIDHPEKTPREIAEMWLNLALLGIWGILDDEGKEVLLNAENSR